MNRPLVAAAVGLWLGACGVSLTDGRSWRCDSAHPCDSDWFCAKDGWCRRTTAGEELPCDTDAQCAAGWVCGEISPIVEGKRCRDVTRPRAYPCDADVLCDGTWRCGIDFTCHPRDAGAWPCLASSDCEAGWVCGVDGRCLYPEGELLEPGGAVAPAEPLNSPTDLLPGGELTVSAKESRYGTDGGGLVRRTIATENGGALQLLAVDEEESVARRRWSYERQAVPLPPGPRDGGPRHLFTTPTRVISSDQSSLTVASRDGGAATGRFDAGEVHLLNSPDGESLLVVTDEEATLVNTLALTGAAAPTPGGLVVDQVPFGMCSPIAQLGLSTGDLFKPPPTKLSPIVSRPLGALSDNGPTGIALRPGLESVAVAYTARSWGVLRPRYPLTSTDSIGVFGVRTCNTMLPSAFEFIGAGCPGQEALVDFAPVEEPGQPLNVERACLHDGELRLYLGNASVPVKVFPGARPFLSAPGAVVYAPAPGQLRLGARYLTAYDLQLAGVPRFVAAQGDQVVAGDDRSLYVPALGAGLLHRSHAVEAGLRYAAAVVGRSQEYVLQNGMVVASDGLADTLVSLSPTQPIAADGPSAAVFVPTGDGAGVRVVAAGDTLWTSVGGAALAPQLRLGGVGIASLAVRPAPDAGGFEGYAVSNDRLVRLEGAARVTSSEVDLPGRVPGWVWYDGQRARVAATTGEVISLPSRAVLSAAAPGQPVLSMASACRTPFALSYGGLFRLGGGGQWEAVPLPPGADNVKLFALADGVVVARSNGELLRLRVSGSCE